MVLAAASLLAFPAIIKADTATPQLAPNAGSIAITPPDTKAVWVTAYTSDPDETSDHPLITASGDMVRDGVVADNLLPFGTQIEIPTLFGNKVFTVEDRTSQKFSGRVDIWMPTINKALDFGIRHVQIVILDQSLAMK
jgi:3D (Asp-Asp-Asp) domain-containing protein